MPPSGFRHAHPNRRAKHRQYCRQVRPWERRRRQSRSNPSIRNLDLENPTPLRPRFRRDRRRYHQHRRQARRRVVRQTASRHHLAIQGPRLTARRRWLRPLQPQRPPSRRIRRQNQLEQRAPRRRLRRQRRRSPLPRRPYRSKRTPGFRARCLMSDRRRHQMTTTSYSQRSGDMKRPTGR